MVGVPLIMAEKSIDKSPVRVNAQVFIVACAPEAIVRLLRVKLAGRVGQLVGPTEIVTSSPAPGPAGGDVGVQLESIFQAVLVVPVQV
jgi:hypothetical protein